MNALVLDLELLEPVLVMDVGGGDPNSAESLPYIPGSTIRGALIARYLGTETINLHTDATRAETFQRLFLNGAVCFLNAYPKTKSDQRALPTPLSWHMKKRDRTLVYDRALDEPQIGPDERLIGVKRPFCTLLNAESILKARLYEPEFHINIHTAREDRQHVTAGESTVFRYRSLAAGQVLRSVVLAQSADDLIAIQTLIPSGGTILGLGHSARAGYGRVRVLKVTPSPSQTAWTEYLPVGNVGKDVVVTLLSDALIRDPHTGAYASTLEPILKRGAKAAFVKTHIVGGFNRTWNLPLPQAQAIQAGSVFVYESDDTLLKNLHDLEKSGIGERRAEGFGRIAVNWHGAAQAQAVDASMSHVHLTWTETDTLQADSARLAETMVKRMLTEKLDRALVQAVNRLSIDVSNQPQNTQLSRMRVIVRRALTQKNIQVIRDHLSRMRRAASSQFQRARVGGQSLTDWLSNDWLAGPGQEQGIWKALKVSEDDLPSIGAVRAALTDELALEYTVRLIDGVLRKALKPPLEDKHAKKSG